MFEIIAVDISGRHAENNEYFMVCAAVSFSVSADHIHKTHQVNIRNFINKSAPDLHDIVRIVRHTVEGLNSDAVIVMESGDLFNKHLWLINSMFSHKIKYQESLAERRAIEIAHHISLSSRKLLKQYNNLN